MKLGASLGGGIGRLREVCGAVSAMVLLAGLLYADTDIPTHERKQAHYARVQELAHRFQSAHGSYLCRDRDDARRRAGGPHGAVLRQTSLRRAMRKRRRPVRCLCSGKSARETALKQ